MLENLKRYGKQEELYSYWTEADGWEHNTKKNIEGDWNGRHFVIASCHCGHPNGYIEVFDYDNVLFDEDGKRLPNDWIGDSLSSVHCGSTVYGKLFRHQNDDRTYIGWDYGHVGDYQHNPKYGDSDGHKWSAAEILMEIALAAYELDQMNDAHYTQYIERKKIMLG